MKIFKQVPTDVIRVQISKVEFATQYLTLMSCTRDEVESFIKECIANDVSKFPEGKLTRVNIREGVGGKNGKSQCFKCYGITPRRVLELVTEKLNKVDG